MIIIATRPERQFLAESSAPLDGHAYIYIRKPGSKPLKSTNANFFQIQIALPDQLGGEVSDYKDAVDVCMAMYRYRKIVISCDDVNSVRRNTLKCFLQSQYPTKSYADYKYDKKILSLLRREWASSVTAESYRNGDRRANRNMVNCVLSDGTEFTSVVFEERAKILDGLLKGANLLDVQIGRVCVDEFELFQGNVKTYPTTKNLVSHIKTLTK
jgi:hypothetical protein